MPSTLSPSCSFALCSPQPRSCSLVPESESVSHSVVSDSLWPHGLYSPPGSSVHGVLQARILEWVAIPFSRGSSQPRDWTQISYTAGRLPSEPPEKPMVPGIQLMEVWEPPPPHIPHPWSCMCVKTGVCISLKRVCLFPQILRWVHDLKGLKNNYRLRAEGCGVSLWPSSWQKWCREGDCFQGFGKFIFPPYEYISLALLDLNTYRLRFRGSWGERV